MNEPLQTADGDYSAPPEGTPSLFEVLQSEGTSAAPVGADDGSSGERASEPAPAGEVVEAPELPADEPEGSDPGEDHGAPDPKEAVEEPEQDLLAGLPKPQDYGFDPGKLDGVAKDVHRYYSSVLRHKGSEHAKAMKAFEGIDPQRHQQMQGFTDAVLDHPLYDEVIEPLLNPQHKNHKDITQAVIGIFSSNRGGAASPQARGSTPPQPQNGEIDYNSLIYGAADEDGTIHPEALERAVREAAEKLASQRTPQTPAINGQELWDVFATKHNLPATENKEYGRLYVSLYGNNPPPRGLRPMQVLERIKVLRDAEIRDSFAQARREDEVERKATMPPPTRSTASAPPKLKVREEMTLNDVLKAEREGRI